MWNSDSIEEQGQGITHIHTVSVRVQEAVQTLSRIKTGMIASGYIAEN